MKTWNRLLLWYNRNFRPLQKTNEIILLKTNEIVFDQPIVDAETELVINTMAKKISINKRLRDVPIVVTIDRKLLYGKHRLAALQKLGWKYIPCQVV